ncbi:uncharacterized protein ASCRUDRAFT_7460 [Ascoidea rubescens DSM 1968]|uniref:DAGKc domain-containing protein n=1 Tax=Ascoidea rubescens DSM 1968 TaxID=1344418 RepID=A0A1D2VK65_9ASCO|nr:hypothetical protein ASCRUDRAFT_7460 [Ascoidea rubescens DSM 1968]ODV62012.1 hypothetical protein ASCRUDRAFT_7460 [Ascoidea rubescens DSM 1968]
MSSFTARLFKNGLFLREIAILSSESSFLLQIVDKLVNNQALLSIDVDHLPLQIDSNRRKIIVLDSIHSGKGRSSSSDPYQQLLKILFNSENLNVDHDYYKTDSIDFISNFSSNLLKAIDSSNKLPVTLIIISGDTSINEFVNNLPHIPDFQNDILISVLPLGSGNALASELNIIDPIDSIKKLISNSSKGSKLPLYNATFSDGSYLFLNPEIKVSSFNFFLIFSWCFHASLVADSEDPSLKSKGVERFQIAANYNLNKKIQTYNCDLSINDQQIASNSNYSYFILSAVKNLQDNFNISPLSNLLNQDLYLLLMHYNNDIDGQSNNKNLLNVMNQAFNNANHIDDTNFFKSNQLDYYKIKDYKNHNNDFQINLKINESEKNMCRVCLDGTIIVVDSINDTQKFVQINNSGNSYNNWNLFILN